MATDIFQFHFPTENDLEEAEAMLKDLFNVVDGEIQAAAPAVDIYEDVEENRSSRLVKYLHRAVVALSSCPYVLVAFKQIT